MTTVVLVTGGRDFTNRPALFAALDKLLAKHRSLKVHVGDACGTDAFTAIWCRTRKVPCQVHVADWDTQGRSAGFKRNTRMLHAAIADGLTGAVAFPGGKGTARMVEVLEGRKVPVWKPLG